MISEGLIWNTSWSGFEIPACAYLGTADNGIQHVKDDILHSVGVFAVRDNEHILRYPTFLSLKFWILDLHIKIMSDSSIYRSHWNPSRSSYLKD
jgi:hypothetical protein